MCPETLSRSHSLHESWSGANAVSSTCPETVSWSHSLHEYLELMWSPTKACTYTCMAWPMWWKANPFTYPYYYCPITLRRFTDRHNAVLSGKISPVVTPPSLQCRPSQYKLYPKYSPPVLIQDQILCVTIASLRGCFNWQSVLSSMHHKQWPGKKKSTQILQQLGCKWNGFTWRVHTIQVEYEPLQTKTTKNNAICKAIHTKTYLLKLCSRNFP